MERKGDTFYFLHHFILACSRKNPVVGNPSPEIFFLALAKRVKQITRSVFCFGPVGKLGG